MARPKSNRPPRNDPRMNLAFYGDNLDFCREMAWKNRLNMTQYINRLIDAEKARVNPDDWKQPVRGF